MVLKPEFESLWTQILNSSLMPFLYEAFAMIAGNVRRRQLIQPPPIVISELIPDQMAFVATSGSRLGNRHIYSHCGALIHTKDWFFKLHPKLREKYSRRKRKPISSTTVVAKTTPSYATPDFTQLQSQISQLQTQLASLSFRLPFHTGTPTSSAGTLLRFLLVHLLLFMFGIVILLGFWILEVMITWLVS